MMNYFSGIAILCAILILSGCASVTGSPNQSVSLQTRDASGSEISGATCDIVNKRGTWFVTTPGSVSVHRSNDDLQVTCRKDGHDQGRAAVVSDTKGSMFGNILLGGGIGAIVDHNNGSAYEYPTFIQVIMGKFTNIGTPKEDREPPTNPMMGAAPSPSKTLEPSANKDDATSTPIATGSKEDTKSTKLAKLKELYENKLISEDVYKEQQNLILQD